MARFSARIRLTPRGLGLLVGGALLVGLGITLDLPDLVALGAGAVIACSAAVVLAALSDPERGPSAVRVVRSVVPSPTSRGRTTIAQLDVIAGSSPVARARLARLQLTEQAAPELTSGRPLRATVEARRDRLSVTYPLEPPVRGRWTLGPVRITQTDLLGLVRRRQQIGSAIDVVVRPRTHELTTRPGSAFDTAEAVASGARSASTDDAMVRDYVPGDDPRRVHWPSAARRGRLLVRADESSAVAPATVLLDLGALAAASGQRSTTPTSSARTTAGEWALECALSVAVALLRDGHRTRWVTTRAARLDRVHLPARSADSTATLLDAAVDLTGHLSSDQRQAALVDAAERIGRSYVRGELVVAVVHAMGTAARRALAAVAVGGTHVAIVVIAGTAPVDHVEAEATASALRQAGWSVTIADPRVPVGHAWDRLHERAA